MADWTGVQRREQHSKAIGGPSGPVVYVVEAGTPARCKPVGGKWRDYATRRRCTFNSTYKHHEPNNGGYTFFQGGWLLWVPMSSVELRRGTNGILGHMPTACGQQ